MISPDAEKGAVTILMAEDDPDDRMAINAAFGEVLRGEFQLHFVENGQELIDYLTRRWKFASGSSPLPHLILLAYVVKPSCYSQLVDTVGTFCRYWFQRVSLPPERI